MKLPKYIACIAEYYASDPEITVMHSVVIIKSETNKIEVSRYFNVVDDYIEDDAKDEIDALISDYKKKGTLDMFYGHKAIPLVKFGDYYTLKKVTVNDYVNLINKG